MTTLRPERSADDPMSYENTGQFKAVVEQLDDPLNDPLPGRAPAVEEHRAEPGTAPRVHQDPAPYADPSPYPTGPGYRPGPYEAGYGAPPAYGAHPAEAGYEAPPAEPAYPARGYEPQSSPWFQPHRGTEQPADPADGDPPTAQMPALDDGPEAADALDAADVLDSSLDAAPVPAAPAPPTAPSDGGRAARRKAARQGQGGGGHRAGGRTAGQAQPGAQEAAAPLSRVEARRAARAAKEGPAVIASRAVGELFITAGVLMLLFVTYQLWWTNVRAHREANSVTNNLQHQWDSATADPDRAPGTFSPGQGFAVMYIPKLDVKAPIAEGVSKPQVLDKGMIGHYTGALKTAMPWDKTGNFAVAAHRNTHGEPFRYINHLEPGDKVIVETEDDYYTYVITSSLPSTPPSNISVLKPIPTGSGFTKPGRYLTLTTCTPEFQSTNRLIVWGKLVEDRPRSKGKPDALVDN